MGYSWGDDSSVSTRRTGYDYSSIKRGAIDDKKILYAKDSKIITESPFPVVVAVDVTGSMSSWPKIIFDRLPLLYQEAVRYLPGVEISFCAVGDAYSDRYPLQTGDFKSGPALDEVLNSIYPEGAGGGQCKETYELAAYFYAKHCKMPKAKKPMMFFTGDEGFYTKVNSDHVKKHIGDSLKSDLKSTDVFKELTTKFDTYIFRKQYGCGLDEKIEKQWKGVLGDEKVLSIDHPERIVDCIIGVIAASADGFDEYSKLLSKHQTPEQVSQVMKTLRRIGRSQMKKLKSDKGVPI